MIRFILVFALLAWPVGQLMSFGPGVEAEDSLTIVGVGDIMMGTNYPSSRYLPPNDGKDLLSSLSIHLKNADVTFGNLEGTLLDKGGAVKRCSDPSKCYAFRMPQRYAGLLKEHGFDVLSIANNHVGDFGQSGRNATIQTLQDHGFHFAGLTSHKSTTWEQDGVVYGFCAFAPNSGTVDIRDIPGAKLIVQELAEQCDVVIVSFHGGAEGTKYQHVTRQTERFYGENRGNVYQFSHAMIDAGADIIFGHGPHVTRAMEIYKERFIIYSLGNFCTYARFNLRGANGIAPLIKLKVKNDGTFLSGQIVSVIQEGEGGPKIDGSNRAVTTLQALTRSDFPESKLVIEDNGKFYLP
jgi:hypothetical protein